MPFQDYSATPSANTTIGDNVYIGPNMARNDVREALQTLAADGRLLYDLFAAAALTGAYYTTVAAGAAATSAPDTFLSDEAGEMSLYDHAGALLVEDIFNVLGAIDAITLPLTTGAGIGVIHKGADRFLHDYGTQSLFLGIQAGNFTTTTIDTTAVGYWAGRELTSAQLCTLFGWHAGKSITSGGVNTFIGAESGATCTTGSYNDGVGCKALANATTAYRNKAFGQSCLMRLIDGNDNTCGGQESAINLLHGQYNVTWGSLTLNEAVDVDNCTAIGGLSQYKSLASDNTSVGKGTLYENTTGTLHAVFGLEAGYSNTAANGLAAVGAYSLRASTGTGMTAVGYRSGYAGNTNEQSSVDTYCTFIGNEASRDNAIAQATVLTNSAALGNAAKITKSNQVVLGNSSVVETVIQGVQRGKVYTFATLPVGAAGDRAFISDCNSTTFAAAAAGGGSNGVPVYSDGTAWRVG